MEWEVPMKEYKVMKVKKTKTCDDLEKLMNDMAVFGWEVVAVNLDTSSELTPHFYVTFVRNDVISSE